MVPLDLKLSPGGWGRRCPEIRVTVTEKTLKVGSEGVKMGWST